MIPKNKLEFIIRLTSTIIISFTAISFVGMVLLRQEKIVEVLGGGPSGNYYWYLIITLVSQIALFNLSLKKIFGVNPGMLHLLTIISAYFFATTTHLPTNVKKLFSEK